MNIKFYPVTLLKEVDRGTTATLGDNGIVALKQLFNSNLEKISIKTGIREERIEKLLDDAGKIITGV